jgi:hypothetical protein
MKLPENHEKLDSCLRRNDGVMGRAQRRALVIAVTINNRTLKKSGFLFARE